MDELEQDVSEKYLQHLHNYDTGPEFYGYNYDPSLPDTRITYNPYYHPTYNNQNSNALSVDPPSSFQKPVNSSHISTTENVKLYDDPFEKRYHCATQLSSGADTHKVTNDVAVNFPWYNENTYPNNLTDNVLQSRSQPAEEDLCESLFHSLDHLKWYGENDHLNVRNCDVRTNELSPQPRVEFIGNIRESHRDHLKWHSKNTYPNNLTNNVLQSCPQSQPAEEYPCETSLQSLDDLQWYSDNAHPNFRDHEVGMNDCRPERNIEFTSNMCESLRDHLKWHSENTNLFENVLQSNSPPQPAEEDPCESLLDFLDDLQWYGENDHSNVRNCDVRTNELGPEPTVEFTGNIRESLLDHLKWQSKNTHTNHLTNNVLLDSSQQQPGEEDPRESLFHSLDDFQWYDHSNCDVRTNELGPVPTVEFTGNIRASPPDPLKRHSENTTPNNPAIEFTSNALKTFLESQPDNLQRHKENTHLNHRNDQVLTSDYRSNSADGLQCHREITNRNDEILINDQTPDQKKLSDYKSKICGTTFRSLPIFGLHGSSIRPRQKFDKSGRFLCEICGKPYVLWHNLQKHRRTEHKVLTY